MRTDELNFDLPPDLIAQIPAPARSSSRLLHYTRSTQTLSHLHFSDLPSLLNPGDLLVFNNSRVLPARFLLRKPTGGRIEALFLSQPTPTQWLILKKGDGNHFHFDQDPSISARVLQHIHAGEYLIELSPPQSAPELLSRIGRMPLPPYIKRAKDHDPLDAFDRDRYQTIYASPPGSIAAPTAGLHFTPEILSSLAGRGVQSCEITLHVGLGTFKPITADTLASHPMHTEPYTISPEAASALNAAKNENRRIIAVGTTAARVLESQPPDSPFLPITSETQIFIYPPYHWKHISALITNFHLPRSTLIALVAALVGLDEQRRIYAEAIAQRYRFFSYGDASLLE